MERRILELALETLTARKAAIEAEIEALKSELSPRTPPARPVATRVTAKGVRRVRTAASRKAQSEKMKAYWAKRKAEAAKGAGGRIRKR